MSYPGKRGPIGLCPKCGSGEHLQWDSTTDTNTCNVCNWNDTENQTILYLCDRKACTVCHNELCSYTDNIDHAVSFTKKGYNYFEIDNIKEKILDALKEYFDDVERDRELMYRVLDKKVTETIMKIKNEEE